MSRACSHHTTEEILRGSSSDSNHTRDDILRGSSYNSRDEVNCRCERGSKPLGFDFDMDKEIGDDSEKDDRDASQIRKRPRREVDAMEHGIRDLSNHLVVGRNKSVDGESSQTRISFEVSQAGDSATSPLTWKLVQAKIHKALISWFIADEIPFKTVDSPTFKSFMSAACPMFTIPSRKTITSDIYNLYVEKKNYVKDFIKNHAQRISISVSTCTSIQRVNYMCLTAHFIDDDWNLHKRILNVRPISGDKSDEVGKLVEECLLDWGFDKIFTVTIDNDSSSDVAITHLVKKFDHWGTNLLGGKYVHTRCVPHIVSLIVQNGLANKEEQLAVSRIREAVRYVLHSPARYKRFQELVAVKNLETDKLLSLDVPGKWDSTYFMLESATCFKVAFDAYEDLDLEYKNDLSKPPYNGPPMDYDWKRAELLLKFLKHFYKVTLYTFDSSSVMSNSVLHRRVEMEMIPRQCLKSEDLELSDMARRMKENFDKYWGSIENMNMIFYFALILDPRRKLKFLDFVFSKLYEDGEKSVLMKDKVNCGLQELFNEYKLRHETKTCISPTKLESGPASVTDTSSKSSMGNISVADFLDDYDEFIRTLLPKDLRSELEKYLSEYVEVKYEGFDVLKWWKVSSGRFPVLSQMARDVFAVPVSTVASDDVFSTDRQVLDPYRSSLPPEIVEALICAQDWLLVDPESVTVEEHSSENESLDQGDVE